MNLRYVIPTCTSSPRRAVSLLGVLTLALGGCVLTGIEPDEIDLADEETGAAEADEGGEDPTNGAEAGDGDPGGDGDGDPPGDGDGDPTSTGDGDGDATTGDETGETGEPTPCADFNPLVVVDGDNAIEVAPGQNSFFGSCSDTDGPDLLLSYTAIADGPVSFAITQADFDGLVILAGADCDPLDELACGVSAAEADLLSGETIHVIIESNQIDVGGPATLTITGP